MGKYKIKVHYQTGNSFGSENTVDFLDLSWDNLEIAKENLKAIKDHYKFYESIENTYGSYLTNQAIYEGNKNEWWFAGEKDRWFVDFNPPSKKMDWRIVHKDKKTKKQFKDFPSEMRWNDMSHYRMKLKTDSGKTMQQRNFWCGYFERLNSAEIVSNENDMKFYA